MLFNDSTLHLEQNKDPEYNEECGNNHYNLINDEIKKVCKSEPKKTNWFLILLIILFIYLTQRGKW
jgi:cell division protein FtsB